MNPEIVNIYIERLLQEIQELTKNRLLIETQLRYTERLNADLNDRLKKTEEQLEKEKINKKKTKEVNTSDSTF